jgi:beta-phosphoglucomutase-like phosphatase (HAD superfamily)
VASRRLGVRPEQSLAVEDSAPGVQSAVAAGHPTVGNVTFVNGGERPTRRVALVDAGAVAVVDSGSQLATALLG